MKYNPIIDKYVIDDENLKYAGHTLLNVIRHARILAGVTLDKRSRGTFPMAEIDHLEANVISAAKAMGIDFGVQSGNDLDVREAE